MLVCMPITFVHDIVDGGVCLMTVKVLLESCGDTLSILHRVSLGTFKVAASADSTVRSPCDILVAQITKAHAVIISAFAMEHTHKVAVRVQMRRFSRGATESAHLCADQVEVRAPSLTELDHPWVPAHQQSRWLL